MSHGLIEEPDGFTRTPGNTVVAVGRLVVSDVRSIREAVGDGENGLLVPENAAPALARALCRLAEEDGLAARQPAGGRETVRQQFSLTGNTGRLRALLTAV